MSVKVFLIKNKFRLDQLIHFEAFEDIEDINSLKSSIKR